MYMYRISSLKESSAKYGLCEVCKTHVSECFIQSEQKEFVDSNGEKGFTFYDCKPHTVGHYDCLLKIRKNSNAVGA